MQVENVSVAVAELARTDTFRHVLELWESLRDDRFAPPWQTDSMIRLPGRVLPFLTVVDVCREPEDYVYRLWGTGHTAIKGIDLTGRSVLAYDAPELGQVIFDELRAVVTERVPLGFRHDVLPQPDRFSLFQDTLRLPLSADGETVTQVLSYADWQSRGDEWKQLFGDVRQFG